MIQKIRFLPVALLAIAITLAGCEEADQAFGSLDSRKPFIVQVLNNGGTRGVAISTVSSFNMVGIQGASSKWMDNFLFTNSESGWVAAGHDDLRWPGGTDTHTFYATCDNTNKAPAITDGKFVYTVPSDISKQKDLLVALSEGKEDGTPVSLLFKHALSSVKFKIGYDKEARGGEGDLHIHVTKITLYHIATKGTFDFANYATNPWSVDPGDAEYKDIVITLKTPVDFTPSAVDEFIPLEMTNGFGFNKTNVINVRMDKMKYPDGKDFYAPFIPIINSP